ncbi:DNA cytosine methyltransferase [Streptomyces sp. NPDC089424]|uniref:DNA cytosine methyltransferase n=1 Tax=Streptomyces sp. NPDC089424 TaxID=3365917 RepID=UPI0038275426
MSRLSAVDLFAGAGGATQGLRDAGFRVLAAVENDRDAARSYRRNHRRVLLLEQDVRLVDPRKLRLDLGLKVGELDLLKACPPCQGFSTLAKGEVDEERNNLVLDVRRFVVEMKPKALLLENVPGLQKDRRLVELVKSLEDIGYRFHGVRMNAEEFGVPQRRKRYILVGLSKSVPATEFPDDLLSLLPSKFDRSRRNAGSALRHLERYKRSDDPLDVHRQSNPAVLARIKAIPINGNRFDLPPEHQLDCHKNMKSRRSAAASYGRVKLAEPAPTMTTRCTTPACGTFVHPEEDRGLTLREAAVFQTFPLAYTFVGDYGSIERQIGNAVPVRMAKGLGLIVSSLLGGQDKPTEGA